MFLSRNTAVAPLALRAVDGVNLRGVHLPAVDADDGRVAIVVAHGFTGELAKPAVGRILARLRRHAGVIGFDFRGHGGSAGLSTLGDEEVLDVDSAVAAARALGYAKVATLGFSMGGACVLRHAALVGSRTREPVDAVATVSAVSRWYRKDTPPMRRLHWAVQTDIGRATARRLLRTRVAASGWTAEPTAPELLVGRIAPVPLLLIHGDADRYLGVDNAQALRAAAGEPTTLWIWPGFGHAETGMDEARTDRVGAALVAMAEGQAQSGWDIATPTR